MTGAGTEVNRVGKYSYLSSRKEMMGKNGFCDCFGHFQGQIGANFRASSGADWAFVN